MTCDHCGSVNIEAAASCNYCGSELRSPCPNCDFRNIVASRFCAGCGDPLAADQNGRSADELRQVTVLFCDLVGSMELSQVLDLEDLRDLLASYHRICADAVAVQEGHIAQYLGDGVLAYFGYPRSHEDDALRAVRCGLEILRKTKALTSHLHGHRGDVLVRLGAHTGRVVMSEVGDSRRRDYLALGDTPNIAARVQAEAEPGSLLVTEATWTMVVGFVTGEATSERTLRGLTMPMRLWRVYGETGLTDRVEVSSLLTPFVGRAGERAALGEAWRRSQGETSCVVLVRGEPGVGKSRLVRVAREDLSPAPAFTLLVRARPANNLSPFRPVIELLERGLGLHPELAVDERARRLQEGLQRLGVTDPDAVGLLGSLLSSNAGARPSEPALSPRVSGRAPCSCLSSCCVRWWPKGQPCSSSRTCTGQTPPHSSSCLFWWDSRQPPGCLAVFTTRTEFDPPWCHSNEVSVIDVTPLPRFEAEAVVRGVASGKTVPGDYLRRIVVGSGGIPLFAEELTRSLLDSGALIERASSWEPAGPIAADAIPANVEASLTSRIDRLGPAKATALLAATIGREFNAELLCRVSDLERRRVQVDLARLLDSGVAFRLEDRPGVFAFRHALLRDAAYNMLPRATRQEYHGRIAADLERFKQGTVADRPERIAYHLSGAGDYEEALDHWEAAGAKAISQASHVEAVEHFRQALTCLEHLAPSPDRELRELGIQIKLSQLLMTVYGWGSHDAEAACSRALQLAQDLNRPLELCGILWGVWSVQLLRGNMAPALGAAEDVLRATSAVGPPLVEAGYNAVALTTTHQGDFERALKEADAGLRMFHLESERLLMDNLAIAPAVGLRTARATALWMFGRTDEAQEEWNSAFELARMLGHRPTLAAALCYALQAGCFQGSHQGSLQHLLPISEQLSELSEEFFFWAAANLACRGAIEETLGHPEAAAASMHEGLELFQLTGARCGLVHMAIICAEAFYRMGDDSEASRLLDIAEDDVKSRGEGLYAPEIWRVRGRLVARSGQPWAAEPLYFEAVEQARAQGAKSLELRASLDIYDLFEGNGRAAEGRDRVAAALEGWTQGMATPEVARALQVVNS